MMSSHFAPDLTSSSSLFCLHSARCWSLSAANRSDLTNLILPRILPSAQAFRFCTSGGTCVVTLSAATEGALRSELEEAKRGAAATEGALRSELDAAKRGAAATEGALRSERDELDAAKRGVEAERDAARFELDAAKRGAANTVAGEVVSRELFQSKVQEAEAARAEAKVWKTQYDKMLDDAVMLEKEINHADLDSRFNGVPNTYDPRYAVHVNAMQGCYTTATRFDFKMIWDVVSMDMVMPQSDYERRTGKSLCKNMIVFGKCIACDKETCTYEKPEEELEDEYTNRMLPIVRTEVSRLVKKNRERLGEYKKNKNM